MGNNCSAGISYIKIITFSGFLFRHISTYYSCGDDNGRDLYVASGQTSGNWHFLKKELEFSLFESVSSGPVGLCYVKHP
jgi:hypothetical protein